MNESTLRALAAAVRHNGIHAPDSAVAQAFVAGAVPKPKCVNKPQG